MDKQLTVDEALEQLELALSNLSVAVNHSIRKFVVSEKRIQSLKITSQNNFVLSKDILTLVCEILDVSIDTMLSKNKTQFIVDARYIYFFIVKKVALVEITLNDLGLILNKNHATVLYGIKHCTNLMEVDKVFNNKINKVIQAYNEVYTSKTENI